MLIDNEQQRKDGCVHHFDAEAEGFILFLKKKKTMKKKRRPVRHEVLWHRLDCVLPSTTSAVNKCRCVMLWAQMTGAFRPP